MANSMLLVKTLMPVFDSLTQFSNRKRCANGAVALCTKSFTAIMLSDVDLMLRTSDLVIWLF